MLSLQSQPTQSSNNWHHDWVGDIINDRPLILTRLVFLKVLQISFCLAETRTQHFSAPAIPRAAIIGRTTPSIQNPAQWSRQSLSHPPPSVTFMVKQSLKNLKLTSELNSNVEIKVMRNLDMNLELWIQTRFLISWGNLRQIDNDVRCQFTAFRIFSQISFNHF